MWTLNETNEYWVLRMTHPIRVALSEALLDMLHEARESEDIGQAVLTKYEAALTHLGVEYDPED